MEERKSMGFMDEIEIIKMPYVRNGSTIFIGSYPQNLENNEVVISNLNKIADEIPKNGNDNGWTSYKFFIGGKNDTDFMWYKDVDFNGKKYRGVYFDKYRPSNCKFQKSTCQLENGFKENTVYWFKFEPIKWNILDINERKALLLMDKAIDSRQFLYLKTDLNPENKNIITLYANSEIRNWLNEIFYNIAFDNDEKNVICKTEIKDKNYSQNKKIPQIEETLTDKLFLLNIKELDDLFYGRTINICKESTDYANCLGCKKDSSTGKCSCWLREWVSYTGIEKEQMYKAYSLNNFGKKYEPLDCDDTNIGVCCAMWINL